MKKIAFGFVMFATTFAHAFTDVESRVLEELIKKSSTITVVDEDQTPAPESEQFPALFTQALMQNYYNMEDPGGKLSSVTVSCEVNEPEGTEMIGFTRFSCTICFSEGDFFKKGSTMIAPDTQGQMLYTIDVMVSNNPKYDVMIESKTVVPFAGE